MYCLGVVVSSFMMSPIRLKFSGLLCVKQCLLFNASTILSRSSVEVKRSWIEIPKIPFLVRARPITFLTSLQFTINPSLQFIIYNYNSQFLPHISCFTLHNSQFTYRCSHVIIYIFTLYSSHFTVHTSHFIVHSSHFKLYSS